MGSSQKLLDHVVSFIAIEDVDVHIGIPVSER